MADGRESRVFSTKSLYELSGSAVADKFSSYKAYLTYLPENVLFDIYYQVNIGNVMAPSGPSLVTVIARDVVVFVLLSSRAKRSAPSEPSVLLSFLAPDLVSLCTRLATLLSPVRSALCLRPLDGGVRETTARLPSFSS